MPTLRIPSQLRALTGGAAEIAVTAPTVRAALAELDRLHPGIAARLFDARGNLVPFIRIFVGGEDLGSLHGLDTELLPRDEVAIVPAIAGGR